MRLAVIGHVEHVTSCAVPALPATGDICHLDHPRMFPGGGGGVAFYQLLRAPSETLLFTALGDDDAARFVEANLAITGAQIHAARRSEPHTRDVVMVTPEGQRTIIVVGQPLHPHHVVVAERGEQQGLGRCAKQQKKHNTTTTTKKQPKKNEKTKIAGGG